MSNKKETGPTNVGEIEVFNFSQEKAPIRVQVVNGEPWFVAKDVCQVFGISNHKDAISRLDDDERKGVGITDPLGIRQTANAVSESGLYSLIFQSRKPEAKKFRKWVTGEVLPSIRRKGCYGVKKGSADFLDVRDVPYKVMKYMDGEVRVVEVDGENWYSLNDIHSCIGVRTESTQSVRKLNAKQELARKMWLYGVPNPGWFIRELGVKLLLCASQKVRRDAQLKLDFDFGED